MADHRHHLLRHHVRIEVSHEMDLFVSPLQLDMALQRRAGSDRSIWRRRLSVHSMQDDFGRGFAMSSDEALRQFVGWSDEDYAKARNCMLEKLRGYDWVITDNFGEAQFDDAFQHAVGILALTAKGCSNE